MNSPLSLCVVGCGAYSAEFAASLKAAGEPVRLFFASRDPARARDYCRRFEGSGYFGSYLDAARDDIVEALYICTPHNLHREHSALGSSNGKHVLVEKPIAHDMASAVAMVESARKTGTTLMVAENLRFMAQFRLCKKLLDEGAIGRVRLLQFQEEYPFRPGGWRGDVARNGGGVLIDGGIHKLHALRYLLGEPASVFAAELPAAMPAQQGEDGMAAVFCWESGAVGFINHSWTAAAPHPPVVTVAGSKGRITFNVGDGKLSLDAGDGPGVWTLPDDQRGIPEMVREFRSSIRENRMPETGGEEGLRDVNLVFAAYESARLGSQVPVVPPV